MTQLLAVGVFKSTYYGTLHTLVIFIVLGIAADDIFVFVDAWRQSAIIEECEGDLKMRLAYSFRRAARATAVTSSTTSAAFIANAFSPIMPIASFGIYAAIIVSVNFILVIFVFPPTIIWHQRNLNGKWCCCGGSNNKIVSLQSASAEETEGRLERFFRDTWNTIVFRLRWIIVILFLGWTVVAAFYASKLQPQ